LIVYMAGIFDAFVSALKDMYTNYMRTGAVKEQSGGITVTQVL